MIELARRRMMMGGTPIPTWLTDACEQYSLNVANMVAIWQSFPEVQYVFEPNAEGKYLYLYSPSENARIDTLIKPTSSDVIYCEGQMFKFGNTGSPAYAVSNRGKYALTIGNSGWQTVNASTPYPNNVTIENGTVTYRNANNITFFTKTNITISTAASTLYLFSWHNSKEAQSTAIKKFWFKTRGIFLIPYLNPSDRKYYMIDVNSMNICNNIGTADFEIRYI